MVASLQTSGNSNGAWLQHQHTATSRAASQLPLPKCLPPAEQAAAAVGQGRGVHSRVGSSVFHMIPHADLYHP